jgi:hypothetical protein
MSVKPPSSRLSTFADGREHPDAEADREPHHRRLAKRTERAEREYSHEAARDVGGIRAQRRQFSKLLADERPERNEEERDEREQSRDDDDERNRSRLGRVAEDAPKKFIRVVRDRDAGDAEHRYGAKQQQARRRRKPLESLCGARAQESDAHPEERRDEHEILIESEYAHVGGRIADERELKEENEPGVAGEMKRGAIGVGRGRLKERRREGPSARRRWRDRGRGGRHIVETTAVRPPSPVCELTPRLASTADEEEARGRHGRRALGSPVGGGA